MAGTPQGQNYAPPAVIGAIGGVMALAIVAAAVGRHSAHEAAPTTMMVASRVLSFTDLPDGSVGVTDASTGGSVATLERNHDSFIRATVRDVGHVRSAAGEVRSASFRLTAWDDGRLTLASTTGGRALELEAFGPTNEAAFARLLTAEETQR